MFIAEVLIFEQARKQNDRKHVKYLQGQQDFKPINTSRGVILSQNHLLVIKRRLM